MLHLAVIGIVCAVSAPAEGTALINRKNNASEVFCHFDGGHKNVVSLPDVYDVVVHNSSECAGQKITNRTSSFFYEYIIKQYRDSKNSSCSIMESVSSGKKKRFQSNVSFPYRKKRSPLSTKTLRPPLEKNTEVTQTQKQPPPVNTTEKWHKHYKSDLNCNEKKFLFRLTHPVQGKRKTLKGYKRHLDRLKVDDELDLNKRIEKLVKEIALENQRKENSEKELTLSDGVQDDYVERSPFKDEPEKPSSFPFFNHIKKIFSFSKNYFNNKVSSVPINSARGNAFVSDKAAHISSYDLLKTMRKTTRFRRNTHTSHIPYRCSGNTVCKNKLIEKSYPHSAHFKEKRHLKRRRTSRKFIHGRRKRRKHRNMKRRKAKRRGKKVKTWPLYKNSAGHDLRRRRNGPYKSTVNSNEGSATQSAARNVDSAPLNLKQGPGYKGKFPLKGHESNEESSSSLTNSEQITESPENEFNMLESDVPQHTLEKPFLEQNFRGKNSERTLHSVCNSMTELPLYPPVDFPLNPKYKYGLPNEEYLTADRYLQIRHALRSYLVDNNVFPPVKRTISPERSKRCGKCRSRKCWRSPPLLCIPYIKKGQEDQLRYLIRIMQSMIGKPFPPKVDIFERTKFKPDIRKEKEEPCDYSQDDDYADYPAEQSTSGKNTAYTNSVARTCSPAAVSASCASPGRLPFRPPALPPARNLPPTAFQTYPPITLPPVNCPPVTYPSSFPPLTPYGPPRPINPQQMCESFTPSATAQEYTGTDSMPASAELPFSFPVLGQGSDQTTSCNFDDFATASSPYTATPFCHTPIIPTAPLWSTPPPPSSTSSTCPTANCPTATCPTASCPTSASSSPNEQTSPPPPTTSCKTSPTTVKVHAMVNSEVPVEQKEYFSFAAFSYNGGPGCATETYQYSESVTSRPFHTQPPPFPLCNTNQRYYPPRTVCEGCYTTSHFLPSTNTPAPLRTAPTANIMSSPATQKFQPQIVRQAKGYRKQYYPEYILGNGYIKRDQRNRKPLKGQLMRPQKMVAMSPAYEDQFNPPTEPNSPNAQMKYEIAQNRLFRMHHKGGPKHTYVVKNTDYDFYDKYPHQDQKQKEIRCGKYPQSRTMWNEYGPKTKEVEKRDKLIRHKRGDDYYSWPEGLENYNDYLDDPSYGDEYHREMPGSNVKGSDTWTPPSYDMFSELAKAVTYRGTTTPSNSSVTVSNENTFTNTVQSPPNCANTRDSGTGYTITTTTTTTTAATTTGRTLTNYNDKKLLNSHSSRNDHAQTDPVTYSSTLSTSIPTSNHSHELLNRPTTLDSDSGWIPDDSDDDDGNNDSDDATTEDSKKRKTVFFPSNGRKTTGTTNSDEYTTESSWDRGDDPKRKKTVFFPSYSKTTGVTGTTDSLDVEDDCLNGDGVRLTTEMNLRRGKEIDEIQNLDSADEGQMPTTLKMASIAKGLKKLVTKPCPKVYTKVYPDSLGNEPQANGTTATSKVTTMTSIRAKTTPPASATSTVDLKLQILAVCEGYLEVIKLIKAQNQTPAEALDMDLARYCENIISQSFNYQLDKSKKPDSAESSSQLTGGSGKADDKTNPESGNDTSDTDDPDSAADYFDEEEAEERKKNSKGKKNRKTLTSLDATAAENETSGQAAKPDSGKRKKKRKSHYSAKRQECQQQQQQQQATEDGEELLTKGVTQEQVELIKLLRRRKKALLSWLLNSRDQDKEKDMQETEYIDDDDFMESDVPQDSGTVKPKRDEKTSGTTEKKFTFVNESIFPVYAKQYGYDSGGEVREVEVLWRKINEKTHEKKIFKNVSVLALLLTSTNTPDLNREETKLVGSNGCENEDISEIQTKYENKAGFAVPFVKYPKKAKTTTTTTTTTTLPTASSATPWVVTNKTEQTDLTNTTKPPRKNATHTFITKPDESTIVGKPPNMNKTHPNTTHKISHRFGAAKDLFQEYSIEFLDYAVYILPIMFTILFLFCCLCCAVHIFHTRKRHKKKKKKKKIPISSDDTTETTESEYESKKRKREAKRKRKSKEESDGALDGRGGKKFWNVLKLHPPKAGSEANESNQTEKKKSFLGFLKGKRDEDKTGSFSRLPLCEADEIAKNSHDSTEGKHSHDSDEKPHSRGRKREEEKHKTDGENEAAERRELIALLEELKKIETEHTEEKKEVKSVHVQYMTQEDENVFQRPEFSYPYEKNVFGLPKGYSFCSKQLPFDKTEPAAARDYELYDGVNELTELLPCECSYYSKRNDYCDFRLNQEGRCQRFLNVFRDSSVSRSKPFIDKNCRKNESENRTFIFNKYRSISTDESDGFLGVTHKNAGTEVRFMENASPFAFGPQNNADLVEEMENFKRQLNKKKNVRLKDDGVLCRL